MRLEDLKENNWYYIIINEERQKPIIMFKLRATPANPNGWGWRIERSISLELHTEGILIDFKKDQIPLIWESIKEHTYPISKMKQEIKREFFRKMFYKSTKIVT